MYETMKGDRKINTILMRIPCFGVFFIILDEKTQSWSCETAHESLHGLESN